MKTKQYSVGAAQTLVLQALGFCEIADYREAEEIFETLGMVVTPIRDGNTYKPSISFYPKTKVNELGKVRFEYVSLSPERMEAIAQWID